MSQLTQSDAVAGVVAASLMLVAGFLDLAEFAGAHPSWSSGVVYIGVPIGIILAALVKAVGIGRTGRLVLYAALLGAAVWATQAGKARFVESFAEDRVGGQMWYIGWIATAAFGTALLARLISRPTS